MNEGLRTGQVAAAAGVNVQTLRYYERRGPLADPDRTWGGHRLYPPEAVMVLRVVAATLRTAIPAGCDDLVACAASPGCPLPFHRHTAPAQLPR